MELVSREAPRTGIRWRLLCRPASVGAAKASKGRDGMKT